MNNHLQQLAFCRYVQIHLWRGRFFFYSLKDSNVIQRVLLNSSIKMRAIFTLGSRSEVSMGEFFRRCASETRYDRLDDFSTLGTGHGNTQPHSYS